MVSWLAVRNDKANYGQMILFNFPKNTNILGPDQFEVNINQISEISKELTLWGQGGSRVFKGSLLVIPIENSILYVEPIYIQANSDSSIPQVKRVVVGYQQGADFKHGIGDDLNSAIDNLFGNKTTPANNNKPETNNQESQQDKVDSTPPTVDESQSIDRQKLDELQQKLDELMKQSQEINELLKSLKK